MESLERRALLASAVADSFAAYSQSIPQPARQMELLNRGLVALRTSSTNVFLSWRLLGTDASNVGFNVYRSTNGGPAVKLNGSVLAGATHYSYSESAANLALPNSYHVKPVINNVEQAASETFTLAPNTPIQQYLNVPLQIPAGGTTPDNVAYTYAANDASVGDVDGDGEYEIILKWDPTNSKDNSQTGFTGNVYLDAYKLNGTRLWRIDLGINIRAGAHYTQFIVYDLDGDGRAEVACKTAPGTKDGLGNNVILGADNPNADYRDYDNSDSRVGYVLAGPEYLTVFDGLTGANLATTNFQVARGSVSSWGDSYGNRVDRFLATVAYLDGQRPSLVMGRGYYERSTLSAWDWRNGQLRQRWVFDTEDATPDPAYSGQGTHSLSVADVDGDGRDEIVYGACVIDDNGTGLYSTGLGHGDALHVSDMIPSRPGLEVFQVHESPSAYGTTGGTLRDAATGEVIVGMPTTGDVGRGNAFDIEPNPGYEIWNSSTPDIYAADGSIIAPKPGNMFINFGAWWDGDLYRELVDGTTISDWNYTTHGRSNYDLDPATGGTQGSAPNASSNNGTKSTPALSGDILGDWREEVIWRRSDNTALEIFVSSISTSTRMYTLMHDPQYRASIAWQNGAYNQPPHPGFFLGNGMAPPPTPNIYYPTATGLPPNCYQAEQAAFGAGSVIESTNAGYNATGYINLPTSGGFNQFNNVDGGAVAGVKTLNIRYALGAAERTGRLLINGVAQDISFPPTGGWTTWQVLSVNVPLSAGTTNTIRFETTGADLANIDEIQVDLGAETGSISGTVFHDVNDDGVLVSEPALGGVTVFLDTNNNGGLDAGEISTISNGSGAYALTALPNGAYTVRTIAPADYALSGAGTATVASGAATSNVHVANERIVYGGTSGVDNYVLKKDAGGRFQIWIGGSLSYTVFAAAPSLTFNLSGGADTMTIDLAGGATLPTGGVTIDAGSGTDSLLVIGAAGSADTAAFGASSVSFGGSAAASHSNVETTSFNGQGGWDAVSATSGAMLALASGQQFQSVTVAAGATVNIPAGGAVATITRALAVTGRLDLADNDLIIDYSDASPLGTWNGAAYTGVTGMIQTGRGDGSWSGNGLVTSMSDATTGTLTTLAAEEAFDVLGLGGSDTAVWNGQTIDASAVLVKYTWGGDADLNGELNGDDYFYIDSAVPQSGTIFGYRNGDFNFDGEINGDDYFVIDSNLLVAQGHPPL